jgi:hypothetical protein
MKIYGLRFGTGNPANYTGLTPSFTIFSALGLTAITPPGITETPAGSGLYQFEYGPTQAIKFKIDGGATLADGQKASGFGSLQGGLEVVGDGGTFAGLFFGPALITTPDAKLSGHFQFNLSGAAGVKNRAGYGVGMKWEHFSNAGLILPNYGRDLWTAMLVIPLHLGAL